MKSIITGLIIGLIIGAALGYIFYQVNAIQNEQASSAEINKLKQELSKYTKSHVAEIKKRGYLIVGTSADWPPFEYVSKNGSIVGIDIEIAKRIAEKLDVKLVIKDMKFDALIEALKNGLVDIVIADMTPTAEREKVVDFSFPYYFSKGYAVVTLKDEKISNIKDLYGKTIGVQLGSVQEDWAKKNLGNKSKIISYDKVYPDMVMVLKRGDINAIIVGDITASVLVKKDPSLAIVTYVGGTGIGAAVALPKHAEDLKITVDQVIEQLLESGEMEKIFENGFSEYLGIG